MSPSSNSEIRFNEIIFEGRNKKYGAYDLRKSDSYTIARSLLITFSGVVLLVSAIFYLGRGVDKLPQLGFNLPDVTLPGVEIELPKPPEKQDIPKEPSPPKTDNGRVTVSDTENNKIDINENTIVSKNPLPGTDSAQSTGPVEPIIPAPPVENNKPEVWVSNMPEFNGNLYQFIKDHMKYPPIAFENGTSGLVVLSFIVEKDGSIGEIKVLKDVPDGCTKEAIRVVQSMPKWKPGMNNGVPARVIYNLPVNFRLQ